MIESDMFIENFGGNLVCTAVNMNNQQTIPERLKAMHNWCDGENCGRKLRGTDKLCDECQQSLKEKTI